MVPTDWASRDSRVLAAGFVAVLGIIALVGYQLQTKSYESMFGMVTAFVLIAISIPILRRIADQLGDSALFKVLLAGLVLKFVGSIARFLVLYYVYDKSGDSFAYHDDGYGLLSAWRKGDFSSKLIVHEYRPANTRRISYLTGAVYAVSGPSIFAGFLFYGWLGYIGVLMCWRAVCRSVKGVDPMRAAVILLFYPSLLFWPSSIGKDAVMLLFIGFTAYGAALLLSAPVKLHGLIWFLAGFGGMLLVRPHVGLMAVIALVVALGISVVAGSGTVHAVSTAGRVGRVLAVLVLIAATSIASTQVTKSFEVGGGGEGGTEDALQLTIERTEKGGSAFSPVAASTPLEIPAALVSVLFRPFPWEAGGVAELIAAVEALLLFGLCALSWRRLAAWPRTAWRNPYLIFAMTYCLAFVIGFSYIANFGILARQRTQMLPLFLTVLLVPLAMDLTRRTSDPDAVPLESEGAVPVSSG